MPEVERDEHGHVRLAELELAAWAESLRNQAASAELPGSSDTVAWAAARAAREARQW
jgi:hypothetical protein